MEFRLVDLDDEADVVFLYETRRHRDVCRYLFGSPPPNFNFHWHWLKENIPAKRLIFILWADGWRVGYCQAYDFVGKDTVEVGFVVHPDYQGRGFGKKMVELLIAQLKSKMPKKKIVLFVRRGNERAEKLYEKTGFVKCSFGNEVRYELKE
jgi:ribosomal protein S18 acetylase RimI-like enzyme